INQFNGTGTGANDFMDFAGGGALPSNSFQAGTLVPDIVASFRVDQAWGGAQIAGAAHDNRATYYSLPATGFVNTPGITNASHPDDKWGWAVQGGIEFNLPWAKGDTLAVQAQYCDGASYYCYNTGGTRLTDVGFSLFNTNRIGIGFITDAFFTGLDGQDNSLQLS